MTRHPSLMELPLVAMVQVLIQANKADENAAIRGFGRELLGHSVHAGGTEYSIGEALREVDGKPMRCVMLTTRTNAFSPGRGQTVSTAFIPVDCLRIVRAEVDLLEDDTIPDATVASMSEAA